MKHLRPASSGTKRPAARRLSWSLLALAIGLAAPLAASASGSYCVCIPKPPLKTDKAAKVDKDKFDLGQKVFNGKTAPATGDASAQQLRLSALQKQLPEKVAKKTDLNARAGKLTAEQLSALEYYVQQRYPAGK